MKKKKKKHSHIKWKSVLILLSFILIIFFVCYYFYKLPIKNVYIKGTTYLSDYEIMLATGLKEYPKFHKKSTKNIIKDLEKLDLVNKASVKKTILGKVTIEIDEAKPLFYNRSISAYVLSNSKTTTNYLFTGIPFLVNIVPDNIYDRFIKNLSKVNQEMIEMISEIEYSPSKSGEIIIDDTRFLLRMNDGNQVYINLINIDRLNTYPLIYTILTEKGVLELDSDNERVVFKSYKSILENANKGDVSE